MIHTERNEYKIQINIITDNSGKTQNANIIYKKYKALVVRKYNG